MPRPPGLPCGLLNVGNTCFSLCTVRLQGAAIAVLTISDLGYVNSLLQTLFHAEEFRDELLKFRPSGSKLEEEHSPGGGMTKLHKSLD